MEGERTRPAPRGRRRYRPASDGSIILLEGVDAAGVRRGQGRKLCKCTILTLMLPLVFRAEAIKCITTPSTYRLPSRFRWL
jgi:hypothetical protein